MNKKKEKENLKKHFGMNFPSWKKSLEDSDLITKLSYKDSFQNSRK